MYADVLEGEVLGFTFKAEDSGFAVVRVNGPEGEVIAVGTLAHLREGQRLVARGQWAMDLRRGRQFKVESVLVEEPRTLVGLERYLASALSGVGIELARRIVERFGLDTLRVLQEQPERLGEVAGIGPKTIDRISETWNTEVRGRELEVTLRGHGIGPGLIRKIVARFGKDAAAVVAREPYRLTEVPGIGFRTADGIARSQGVPRDDPARAAAAIQFCLKEAEDEGHCFLPEGVLVARLGVLDVPEAIATARIDDLAASRAVSRRGATDERERPVLRPEMDRIERTIIRDLLDRVREFSREPPREGEGIDARAVGTRIGLELNGEQANAVELAHRSPVTVVTGGPGTGKTTIIRALLSAAEAREEVWLCASPTGRAAKRLSEATGREAKTIHRLLEWTPQGFTRTAEKPLVADGIVVDEASMVDVRLFASLIAAVPPTARLVLVGDVDQLPSVGPGQVLGDLIESGIIPVARLVDVYRQAADSGIVRNAHRINRGEEPVSGEKEEGIRDFFVVAREDAMDAQEALVKVVTARLPANGFVPARDVQVLTPMHAGPLGTVALNERLQATLNPSGEAWKLGKRLLRVNDRVIQLKNDYELELFNGDVGRIAAVHPDGVDLDVDGRIVPVRGDATDAIDLAYAISIHKSQGSEYPAVVVALHPSHFVLLRRNLLYTAITRAKRFACIVGSPRAIRTAVGRRGEERRYTGLAVLLRGG